MPLSPLILPFNHWLQFLIFVGFSCGIATLLLSQNTDRRTMSFHSVTKHCKVTFDRSLYLTRLALAGIKVGQQSKLTVSVFTAVLLKQAPFICRIYLSNVAPIYSRLFFTLGFNNRDKLGKRTYKNETIRTCKNHPNELNSHKCDLSFGPWSQEKQLCLSEWSLYLMLYKDEC